jgi:tetratricopeptide (TPR) repeat protein
MGRFAPTCILLLLVGCTSAATELRTAQTLYKDARYEDALLWLSELETATASMDRDELARFYYLRGGTGFRLGQREDALHYLVLAEQLSHEDSGRLPRAWRPVMERTLQDITPTSASPHARNPLRPDTY